MILHEITAQRAYFEEITFIIPKSWGEEENWISTDGDIVAEIGLERHNEADIFVEAENDFFGKIPYTIQAAGCEQQGLGIHIPETFLKTQYSENSSQQKAQNLVYEWLKYRYGVFDEHGFQNDVQYPVLYGIPGNSKYMEVTSCSNHPVKYNLTGHDEACTINETTGRLNNAACPHDITLEKTDQSSSFMFSPKMSKLCGSGTEYAHDVRSPTKHNILCFENSISEILDKHKDMKQYSSLLGNTTFRYVQESELRLVLAIDRSKDTSRFQLHTQLSKIVNMFLDLSIPKDHSVDLLFYDSRITTTKRFEENWSFPHTADVGPGCIRCALQESLMLLKKHNPVDGSILVLIARHTFADDEIEMLNDIATTNNVRVYVIFCLTDEASASSMAARVAGKGIKIQNIPVKLNNFMYSLYNALHSSVRDSVFGTTNDNIVIMHNSFVNSATNINFTFPIDETAKRDVKILLSTPNLMEIYEDNSGISINGDKGQSRYQFIERPRSGLKVLEILNERTGNVAVSIAKDANASPLEVLVLAKESSVSSAIIVRSWLSHTDQFIQVNDYSDPVILYTEVRSGNFPVRNAKVTAHLHHPSSKVTKFSLTDNGIGDPDITKGDGIYSNYVTGFSTGDYYLEVSVDDGGEAEIVSGTGSDSTCCGSFVPAEKTVRTGRFRRIFTCGSFYVSLPQDQENNDFYPPSRITDFMVTNIFNKVTTKSRQMYITFSFSAPGGNYNNDKASRYEVSCSKVRSAVKYFKTETIADTYLTNIPLPTNYGGRQNIKLEILQTKLKEFHTKNVTTVFVAVRAVDDNNKTGKTSNIVEIQLPVPPPPTVNPPVISTPNPDQDGNNGASDMPTNDSPTSVSSGQLGMIVGIVIGSIVLIIAVIAVLFLLYRRKKTDDNKKSPGNNKVSMEYLPDNASKTPTSLSTPISPVQSWPANVLLDHYNKVQEAKRENGSSDNSIDSSSNDSSCPLKPNPVYTSHNGGGNRYSPSAPYTSSQNSLNQTPRSVTQV